MKRFFVSLVLAIGFSLMANMILANLGWAWAIAFVALVCITYLKATRQVA